MKLIIADELQPLFNNNDPFDVIDNLPGEVFRQLEQRKTQSFTFNNKNYFFKIHNGMSWKEFFKNIIQAKLPVISAVNEWQALNLLSNNGVGVANAVAYADQQGWPASRRSFIVMTAIENYINLEDFYKQGGWLTLDRKSQDKLIIKVATMTRVMHQLGVNHRDCYLCHYLLDKTWLSDKEVDLQVTMIDFHRARIKLPFPNKWRIKDIGSLYYSAIDLGLNKRQAWLFIKTYMNYTTSKQFKDDSLIWLAIKEKADSIYVRDFTKAARHIFK